MIVYSMMNFVKIKKLNGRLFIERLIYIKDIYKLFVI